MNKIINQIAEDYNINPKALKRYTKYYLAEDGIKLKEVTRLQVLEVVYINAPDLLYCRADEDTGTVEYLDINLTVKLCYEMKSIKENRHFEVLSI